VDSAFVRGVGRAGDARTPRVLTARQMGKRPILLELTPRTSLFSRRSRSVAVSATAIAAIAITPGSLAGSPAGPQATRIECQLFHRVAVTREVRTGPIIRVSSQRPTARVQAGAFTFLAKLLAEPGYLQQPSALSIRISRRTTGKVIAAALYGHFKNDRADHGFTGLLYTYTPSGAELQHFFRLL
jgi:hypothetical protein